MDWRSKLFVMAGIPGSGKTTWAKTYLKGAEHYSSDEIRLGLSHRYDQTRNAEVFALFHECIENALMTGALAVVADATFLSNGSREEVRKIADRTGAELHLILFTNVHQAVIRNSTRVNDKVPEAAMITMLEKYEQALLELPQEQYATVTQIGEFS